MNEHGVAAHNEKTHLGFWLYLMTDAMLFASLFATFMILRGATNGGVSTNDIFDLNFILVGTVVLLISSVTCGIANIALRYDRKKMFMWLLVATLLLGEVFIALEFYEFSGLVQEGNTWASSAFLSSFFTLVGLHGLHVVVGLIWGAVVGLAIWRGVTGPKMKQKFALFTVFWHFVDIVWIFIFSIVYVIGVL